MEIVCCLCHSQRKPYNNMIQRYNSFKLVITTDFSVVKLSASAIQFYVVTIFIVAAVTHFFFTSL